MAELPLYKISIDSQDEETGVKIVSFVSNPAIEESFIALSKQEDKAFMAFADDVKQIITGPALIPDKHILRIDEKGNPYNIVFTKEVIEDISKKFFKEANIFNTNFEHIAPLDGNYIVESWLIADSETDKAKALGFNLPAGTWMLSYYVPDLEMYNSLKEEATGFSIEGRFLLDEININNQEKMSASNNLFEKVIAALKPLFVKMEDCPGCKGEETALGPNVARVLQAAIDELTMREENPLTVEEVLENMGQEAGISPDTVAQIVSGEIMCPPMERIEGMARALPNVNMDELNSAWEADGCGTEEETEEASEEKPAEDKVAVEQAKELEAKADEMATELSALKETTAQLMAKVEELKALMATKDEALKSQAEKIAELKKVPAGAKVQTVPGAGVKNESLKNLPFHAAYIAKLKAVRGE